MVQNPRFLREKYHRSFGVLSSTSLRGPTPSAAVRNNTRSRTGGCISDISIENATSVAGFRRATSKIQPVVRPRKTIPHTGFDIVSLVGAAGRISLTRL